MGKFVLVVKSTHGVTNKATLSSVESKEFSKITTFHLMRTDGWHNLDFCIGLTFIYEGHVTIWTTWTSFIFNSWFCQNKNVFLLVFTNLRCFFDCRKVSIS